MEIIRPNKFPECKNCPALTGLSLSAQEQISWVMSQSFPDYKFLTTELHFSCRRFMFFGPMTTAGKAVVEIYNRSNGHIISEFKPSLPRGQVNCPGLNNKHIK